MRKTILTLILLNSVSLLFSQNSRSIPEGAIKRDKHTKETSSPIIDVNHWEQLNTIAQKAYTSDQAARMPLYKIKQVNYLYSNSYKIVNANECNINPDEINFSEIFSNRQESETVIVPLKTNDGCNYVCELAPIKAIQIEFNKIESESK